MARLSTAELIRLLKDKGCYQIDPGGKHAKWFSPITNKRFTVPRDLKGDGTLFKILKDAGIKR
jgi:predicted RNA binding protein YcfA (HicA-like mRNA interferase family)